MARWVLCIGRHTTTRVIEAAGASGFKHHTSFHRFFRQARWDPDSVGVALLKLLLKYDWEASKPWELPATLALSEQKQKSLVHQLSL